MARRRLPPSPLNAARRPGDTSRRGGATAYTGRNPQPHGARMSDSRHRPVHMTVDGVLDLHHFRPREIPDLVREYLRECKRLGIDEVRIVHGKGKGVLRAIVQDILAHDKDVVAFGPAHDGSGWGATIARLRTPGTTATPQQSATQRPSGADHKGWWRRLKALMRRKRL